METRSSPGRTTSPDPSASRSYLRLASASDTLQPLASESAPCSPLPRGAGLYWLGIALRPDIATCGTELVRVVYVLQTDRQLVSIRANSSVANFLESGGWYLAERLWPRRGRNESLFWNRQRLDNGRPERKRMCRVLCRK